MGRRYLRRRRPWEKNREIDGRKPGESQSRNFNYTQHALLLCELIPETCRDKVSASDENGAESVAGGGANASDHHSINEYPTRVCDLIPEVCVNGTVIAAENETNSTKPSGTGDVQLESNSTITGNPILEDTSREELLETLLNHPKVCTLVPQFCEDGVILINATSLSTVNKNQTSDNSTISLVPSVSPTGYDEFLGNDDNETVPSAPPTVYNASLLMDEVSNATDPAFNISNLTTVMSRSPSPAPSEKSTISAFPTASIAPSYSRVPSLSKSTTFSSQPSVSIYPTNSLIPSLSIPPSISFQPSMSIHPTSSENPSTSVSPSFSMAPIVSDFSSTPTVSISMEPWASLPPSTSAVPSISTAPSVSAFPSIASALPSSHPDVRSCENWKSAPEQITVNFGYTVQVTSLVATFVPEMEELILKTVAGELLECDEIRRVAYPDPSSVIGACEPLLEQAKSCWTVSSRLQIWTRNARQAKRDVIEVIRHEFDFGDAVQEVIPNNVFVELQVVVEPPPAATPDLSVGAAVGVTLLCLVVVMTIGAFVKVHHWKTINTTTLLRRKDSTTNQQLLVDGLFPAVSLSGDEMSAAVESDDDGTDGSSNDDDDDDDARIQSKSSFVGDLHESTVPVQPARKASKMRRPPNTVRSESVGSISHDSISEAQEGRQLSQKSILRKPPSDHGTLNAEPERSLQRIDAQFSNPRMNDPERSLTRVDAQFSNPRMDDPERSLTRLGAQLSNPRMDDPERSLTRMDDHSANPRIDDEPDDLLALVNAQFSNPRMENTGTAPLKGLEADVEATDSKRRSGRDFGLNEGFTFRSMRRLERKASTQSYETSLASSIIDSDFEFDNGNADDDSDSDSDDYENPIFSVNIPNYEAVHYEDEDDSASSSEEDRQIDEMRRHLGRQMSERIASIVSADTGSSRSERRSS